jgi:hypothetical protein
MLLSGKFFFKKLGIGGPESSRRPWIKCILLVHGNGTEVKIRTSLLFLTLQKLCKFVVCTTILFLWETLKCMCVFFRFQDSVVQPLWEQRGRDEKCRRRMFRKANFNWSKQTSRTVTGMQYWSYVCVWGDFHLQNPSTIKISRDLCQRYLDIYPHHNMAVT